MNLVFHISEDGSEIELGQDILVVLPTGFGKSMIFTVFALAMRSMRRTEKDIFTCILVISPPPPTLA